MKTYEFFGLFKKKQVIEDDLTKELIRDLIENIIDIGDITEYLLYSSVKYESSLHGPMYTNSGGYRHCTMHPIDEYGFTGKNYSEGVIIQDSHKVFKGMEKDAEYTLKEIEVMLDKHRSIFKEYNINFGVYSPNSVALIAEIL